MMSANPFITDEFRAAWRATRPTLVGGHFVNVYLNGGQGYYNPMND
jgi:hypothetical protein